MRVAVLLIAMTLLAVCQAQVVAKKELLGESNGLYTIRVGYKKTSGAAVSDVRIKDSLPEHLELVQGKLATNGPNVSAFCGVPVDCDSSHFAFCLLFSFFFFFFLFLFFSFFLKKILSSPPRTFSTTIMWCVWWITSFLSTTVLLLLLSLRLPFPSRRRTELTDP
jgi:hypothetical protein